VAKRKIKENCYFKNIKFFLNKKRKKTQAMPQNLCNVTKFTFLS